MGNRDEDGSIEYQSSFKSTEIKAVWVPDTKAESIAHGGCNAGRTVKRLVFLIVINYSKCARGFPC